MPAGGLELIERLAHRLPGDRPVLAAFLIAQWRDGCKREVVYPKEMRTADFVYPAWIKK